MRKILAIIAIIAIFMLAPEFVGSAIAQPPPPDIDPEVPIDSGLTALLVAGMIYGARKLKAEQE